MVMRVPPRYSDFYPRPPRGGRPPINRDSSGCGAISIHALREEGDERTVPHRHGHRYFYPRPPRGGRLVVVIVGSVEMLFLSTPSARRATQRHPHEPEPGRISIHALREEGDCIRLAGLPTRYYFYPRPPRGGRPVSVPVRYSSFLNFYPRPPRGGRQIALRHLVFSFGISIHALREEGDSKNRDKISIFL